MGVGYSMHAMLSKTWSLFTIKPYILVSRIKKTLEFEYLQTYNKTLRERHNLRITILLIVLYINLKEKQSFFYLV